jgi:hypothetical protein
LIFIYVQRGYYSHAIFFKKLISQNKGQEEEIATSTVAGLMPPRQCAPTPVGDGIGC